MTPFVPAYLVALVPWFGPLLLAGLLALAALAAWLIENGLATRRYGRFALGVLIAGYLTAVACAAAGIIH